MARLPAQAARLFLASCFVSLMSADLASAHGQPGPEYDDGAVVIYGRRAPRNVDQLSARVSYADLDLRTAEGERALRWRVNETARDLCWRLGESHRASGPILPSCEADARNGASVQIRRAVTAARAWRPPVYAHAHRPPAPVVHGHTRGYSYGYAHGAVATSREVGPPVGTVVNTYVSPPYSQPVHSYTYSHSYTAPAPARVCCR